MSERFLDEMGSTPRENELNNPAARLYALLISTRNGRDETLLEFWAKNVLPIEPKYPEMIQFFNDVIQLVEECKRIIEGLDYVNQSIYIQPVEEIGNALRNCGTKGTCQQFNDGISDATLASLRFCDDALSRTVGEQMINEELLEDVISDVESLTTKIRSSSIPDHIKAILLDGLEEIRRAIILYGLLGAEQLGKAFDRNIGSFLRFQEAIKIEQEDGDERDIAQDYSGLFSKINSLLSIALKFNQLAAPLLKMIGTSQNVS